MKKLYSFYFISPFIIWFLIYLLNPGLIVVFKRPLTEESLILPIEDLWKIILIFALIQLGNEVLARIFKNYKIFGKINSIFIFLHLLVAFFLFLFNFS